jgi:hypothetical protein
LLYICNSRMTYGNIKKFNYYRRYRFLEALKGNFIDIYV